MTQNLRPILLVLLMAALFSMAYGLNYMYYSDTEITRLGDRIRFFHGDTLCGPIRTNSEFAIIQDPAFCGFAISSAPDFWHGSPYSPVFLDGFFPIFNAPRLEMPTRASQIRDLALAQGRFFGSGDAQQARVEVRNDGIRIWWSSPGVPFDTANFAWQPLPDSAVVFFDCCELHLFGTVGTTLIVGASGTVLLEDNLVYASADAHGIAPAGHLEKLAVVSEQAIKIQNSWANGRENSHGRGYLQTNMDSASIVLDGIYVALNESFTFEQQNDADSGYVCIPCRCNPSGDGGGPDDRGIIYLFGAIMQRQRGYVHRSSCSSTGYRKSARYDNDLTFWHIPVFDAMENARIPGEIDFGVIETGRYGRDTLRVQNDFIPIKLDSFRVSAPFRVVATPDSYKWTQTIPLVCGSLTAGVFTDTLRFRNPYYHQWFEVPVRATVIDPSSADPEDAPLVATFSLTAWPNPFNPSTEIDYSLPASEQVTIRVFDILGQQVSVLQSGFLSAGLHRVVFDGQHFPSGLYFARLETASHRKTLKLVLMK